MYIDYEKAEYLFIIYRSRIIVKCNGVTISKAVAAKSGRNGFVRFYDSPPVIVGDSIRENKIRGTVKISFSPR